ncbi:MAG: lysophospholipid acyltransferase family protein [Paracoccaceae bacterium]|nr:lysophospholipid acyltransferase family protein [Paracoccaceae bacterium]
MAILGIVFFLPALLSRAWAFRACHTFCRWVRWSARWMVGLRTEVRGRVPAGEVMIAAKHQSFLDIILIFGAVPRGKFIMKRELMWAPFIGQYALRLGCVPVDRGKRGAAIQKMLADVAADRDKAGQLIIYPQGTRVAPGAYLPYKAGTGALYAELGQACVPVATNVGLFWPRTGIWRKPGLAVVEFLDPIAPGLGKAAFLERLEQEIETASDALMAEAGFPQQKDKTVA